MTLTLHSTPPCSHALSTRHIRAGERSGGDTGKQCWRSILPISNEGQDPGTPGVEIWINCLLVVPLELSNSVLSSVRWEDKYLASGLYSESQYS